MKALPTSTTDDEIFTFLDGWVKLLDADKYEEAFAHVDCFPMSGWTPDRIRGALVHNDNKGRTQVIYIAPRTENAPRQKQLVRWKENRNGYIGSLVYPFHFSFAQFTATFLLYLSDEGISLQLTDIYNK